MASTAAHTGGSLSHTPHTVLYFTAGINSFFTGILERIKNFTIPKSFIYINYQAEMYGKKEIIISFCIITISASNLYMPMIRLYVFLLDFLIPFLCDPDLQCEPLHAEWNPILLLFRFTVCMCSSRNLFCQTVFHKCGRGINCSLDCGLLVRNSNIPQS
jgi:hypothetical protein